MKLFFEFECSRQAKKVTKLGLDDVNITGNFLMGGLVGNGYGATIDNSYSTGNIIAIGGETGGLVGNGESATITNSYSTVNLIIMYLLIQF